MDLSKISLSVSGEKVLCVGSSVAHHCDFDALQKASKSDPFEIRPIDGGCVCRGISLSDPVCIQDCGPASSECQSCLFCSSRFMCEFPAGCNCIFDCGPMASDCQSCPFCQAKSGDLSLSHKIESFGKTPLEGGCVCIFECKPTSSECQSCHYCREVFETEEPFVDKEAGFNPVHPPSVIAKFSGKTPLEAGCICIFECVPTSSECQSCVYCSDQFRSEDPPPPPTVPNVVKSPPAGKKPISKVVHPDEIVAVRDSVRPMVGVAIKVGDFYGLKLRPGIENKANGNCALHGSVELQARV